MKKWLLFLLVFTLSLSLSGESGVLERYVADGLESNLALKQQEFSLGRSLQALREARGMFLPSVSIEARYSRAGGGRVIEMPIGDLVNPVQKTLNELLMIHGFSPAFPANIANERIPFLREQEHETKLRVVQPLFQPSVYYNAKIKKDLSGIERAKLRAFKRQLVLDIKEAYFNYLKTLKLLELLADTRGLLEEHMALSESLFRNHKVTEEVVFRSRAELSKLEQERAAASKSSRMAASYFNFLLNRPLDTPVEVDASIGPVFKDYDLEKLTAGALQSRAEFMQIERAIAASGHSARLHAASILPTLSAVFDYGFQGETYRFTGEDDYWMGSLVLSWNLFHGGQDKAKQNQALLDRRRLRVKLQELESQIKLQVKEAYLDLEVGKKIIHSALDTLKSRKEAFAIVSRKYREGMVPQIEFTRAQNDMTAAGIDYIVAQYDYLVKEARLERASALRRLGDSGGPGVNGEKRGDFFKEEKVK